MFSGVTQFPQTHKPQNSVMQSDGNRFHGDVISDRFIKTSRDEDKILDQIYK